ncbi:alpha/beta-hydrolase family protein [Tomitella gaofuii]|uniref:alpha/beta-hydrolase family protein n=1 Tax=Tomitella gaofuii TaxID=2760083 RepID=UPI0015F89028|nr:alpha/beta-hydrolase family protein [Tomitella gaofuii]
MTAAPALHVVAPGTVARTPHPRVTRTRASALARALAPRTRTVLGGSAGAVAGVYPGVMSRSVWVEGVTVGAFAVIGVALAVLVTWLWARVIRRPGGSPGRSRAGIATAIGSVGAVTAAAAWSAQWARVSTSAVDSGSGGYWAAVCVIAATVCAAALGAVRLVRARPRAVAALAVVLAAFGSISGASALDGPPAASAAPTTMSTRSGGPGSLVAWDSLGDHGRRFVGDASHPGSIRTYAGLDSASDVTARAALAADDMVRAGGLDRQAVVVMVPTGSGWIDGTAAAGFEELFGGDVAEVGMQYSSAPSWVSYLFTPDDAAAAAHALIAAVADRVRSVPAPQRPELYVYGESMGAAAGARALADAPQARGMVCGALWVGPPARFTDPVPERSSVVVNASDPVPRWDPALALHPAGGAAEAAAPPWLPGVSFLQSSVDVIVSRSGPPGTGHVYGDGQVRGLPTCG